MEQAKQITVVRRFLKFLAVGALGFLVNASFYYLLKIFCDNEVFLRIIAPFFSFEISIFSNYLIYHHWVWRDRRKETRREFWIGFLQYNLAAGFGFLVIVGVMNLAIEFIPWFRMGHSSYSFEALYGSRVTGGLHFAQHAQGRYIFANLCGAAAAALFNFLATDKLVFRKKKQK